MNLAGSLIAAGLFTSIAFSALPLGIANAQDTGKKVILSPNAPNPIGPYSQAIQVGKTVYRWTSRDRSKEQSTDGECVD